MLSLTRQNTKANYLLGENNMEMVIQKVENKFYLYFDEVKPANLCFIGYSLMAAQCRARKLL